MMRRRAVVGLALVVTTAAMACVAAAHRANDGGATTATLPGLPRAVAVDARTGRAFVVTNGYGMFGISNGQTGVFDMHTGVLVRTVLAGLDTANNAPVALALDARAGRVVEVSADNRARILDARSGAPLRMAPKPLCPRYLAGPCGAPRAAPPLG